jgi:hypothetical protein
MLPPDDLAALLQEGLDRHGAASGQDIGRQQDKSMQDIGRQQANPILPCGNGSNSPRQAHECLSGGARERSQYGQATRLLPQRYNTPSCVLHRCWRCLPPRGRLVPLLAVEAGEITLYAAVSGTINSSAVAVQGDLHGFTGQDNTSRSEGGQQQAAPFIYFPKDAGTIRASA